MRPGLFIVMTNDLMSPNESFPIWKIDDDTFYLRNGPDLR